MSCIAFIIQLSSAFSCISLSFLVVVLLNALFGILSMSFAPEPLPDVILVFLWRSHIALLFHISYVPAVFVYLEEQLSASLLKSGFCDKSPFFLKLCL